MDKRRLTFIASIAILLLLSLLAVPSLAAPQAQFTPYPTPTPGSDGKIIYIAGPNDSAWRIAAIFGLKLNDLRTLNKWGDNPIIKQGDQIILGYAGPSEPTATLGPSPTPAPLLPSPSPMPGFGNLCVILYNDQNGDSLHQETEPSIPLGAISVSNRSGSVSKTATTETSPDPICFKELPEGDYNVSVAVPDGYNPTTVLNRAVVLKAGDVTQLNFGAQANTVTVAAAPTVESGGKSPILLIFGIVLLIGGVGLGIFAGRIAIIGRNKTKPTN
jgi:hypothetical protein